MTNKATLKELAQLGHQVKAPFVVSIDAQSDVTLRTLLRIMPGKRIVGIGESIGEHKGKQALIKLFFHSRNYLQELSGFERIKNIDINTPLMTEHIALAEGGICFYELLENAQSFDEVWKNCGQAKQKEILNELLAILKKMYDADLYQSDLHLGNFIYSNNADVGRKLYALDPASCAPLTNQALRSENLANLIAHFPPSDWPMVSAVTFDYFSDLNRAQLNKQAKIKWQKLMKDFLHKIYRECTYIHTSNKKLKGSQTLSICCVRERYTAAMQTLLENIESIPDTAELLKRGESSIVSSLQIDGIKCVIKNSRNKSIWRLLRRCLRRSRASNAWQYSHLLIEAGINTPKPIALVEKKWGPLVLESWFISEQIEGDNLLDVWLYQAPSVAELEDIKRIFKTLKELKISHGDMKATNLLLAEEKIYLIDYDGMESGSNRLYKKDVERFLQNWPNQPWLPELANTLTKL